MMRAFLLLLALLIAPAAQAQLTPTARSMAVELVPETTRPSAGSVVTLAFSMTPREGWHGYWRNPGDAGAAPRVTWTLPQGAQAGDLAYPVPDRLTVAGLMNYIYKGPYAHLVPLRLPAGLAPGTQLPVRARIDYLVCSDELCVPKQAEVQTVLTIGDGQVAAADRTRFDAWRAALPRPLGAQARFETANGRLRLVIPYPQAAEVTAPYLFPITEDLVDHSAAQAISRNGDTLIVEMPLSSRPQRAATVDAVLRVGDGQGLALTAIPGPVPPAGESIAEAGTFSAPAFLTALLGAIIGGLVLNVMPCVFPILSLKALSLARAGGDAREARREAWAYAAGALLTCLGLGAAVLALRAGGEAVGWAFQLQDPRVILLLLLLTTAIALSLTGLFHVPALGTGGTLAARSGPRGAFWTGVLAALVATPCTGPFMGFALGAALVLPWPAALAVFAGLGIGLALPFLLLGLVPALRNRLPRPGPWMVKLQRILSVPMFLTALALAWVLGRQSGVDGMTLGLAATLLLALGLWWLGARQGAGRRLWPALVPVALAAVALPLLPTSAPADATTDTVHAAQPFSEARLAALRSEGRPVFLYFTADWCITCKVNEQAALNRPAVAEAFRARGVQVLVGDWTRPDPTIGAFLASHGRSGIPLYLFYPAGGGAPQVLPQVLTPGMLTTLGASA